MDKYKEAIKKIVEEQQLIVGPVALDLARRVQGLSIDAKCEVTITGDPKETLSGLIMQYEKLFGDASTRVSKRALEVARISFSNEELPTALH